MTGVYRITNTVTYRVYIGSAIDIDVRVYEHRRMLRNGKHDNQYLQRSWDKHRESVFIFEPLIECSIETRKDREQRFIDAYIEHGLSIYNMQPASRTGVNFGYVPTIETRLKISVAHKGRRRSAQHRESIRQAQLGKKLSRQTRERIGLALTGRKRSPEHIENMRAGWARRRAMKVQAVGHG